MTRTRNVIDAHVGPRRTAAVELALDVLGIAKLKRTLEAAN